VNSHLPASTNLVQLADELRALSNAGLRFTQDPYQIERYRRILEISAELTSMINGDSLPELRRLFLEDMHYITPYSVVETAVFDDEGRILLIQRADNHLWGLPGGACDVGEVVANGAAREVWEETGCIVEVDPLIGVFDSRSAGDVSLHHLYIFLFHGTIIGGAPRVTHESVDVRWFADDEIPWDALFGRHEQRIRYALRWYADPSTPVYYDRVPWQPHTTFHHKHIP
jgi:ADP-ribose pyrophosphatase YjhB (NUDIX family)